jgi:hydroxymethylpyrimidine/phosphomethylpyrimidine kinase
MTAVTALTAQNTEGVFGIHEVPPEFVVQQMRLVLADIGADCIKIGMLHRPEIIEAVCSVLRTDAVGIPVVLDPVMMAKGGHPLLAPAAISVLKTALVPLASVLTPNLPEAQAMAERFEGNPVELGMDLLKLGPKSVLVKGGHGEGAIIHDVLIEPDHPPETFETPRIETPHTHGTGCTLASAVAVGLAQKLDVRSAVVRARAYVLEAIRTAPGYGHGHGPLNHAHTVRRFELPS